MSKRKSGAWDFSTPEDADPAALIASLCDDFRRLVGLLDRQIEHVREPDSEKLGRLLKARADAKRGLRLSQLLARNIAGKTDPD